jgi:hypothetical protein
VGLAKPVKQIKKAAPNPTAASAMTWVIAGASGSKGSSSGANKTAGAAPKRSVPASHMLAEASSVES